VHGPGRWPRGLSLLAAVATAGTLAAAAVASNDSISTVAGDGNSGFSGDGGQATAAQLDTPSGVDGMSGGYLIADTANNRVRKSDSSGVINTVAGTGSAGYSGDAGIATSADLNAPSSAAPTADGGFLIADTSNERVRKVSVLGLITTVAGNGSGTTDDPGGGDGGPANLTHLYSPTAVAPTSDGGYLIADMGHHTIRKVSVLGLMDTVAGQADAPGSSGDGGPAISANLTNPHDVSPTADGGYLIADTDNNLIRKVSPGGLITTVAGDGTAGYSEGSSAISVELDHPQGVAALPDGGFLIADTGNNRVRAVSPTGSISTVVGTGSSGYDGDGRPAQSAKLASPTDVAVVPGGYAIADSANHRIRFVAPSVEPAAPAEPSQSVAPNAELPPPAPPVAGKSFNASPKRGVVLVKLPGRRDFLRLEEVASIPVGAVLDTTHGAVILTTARDLRGATQHGTFSAGAFKVSQKRVRRPVTDILLRGGDLAKCPRPARRARRALATASARRGHGRRVWGHVKGHFRTRGRHGAATVRGTMWLTEDRCDGTLVFVRRGLVAVRDFTRKRTFMVAGGKRHFSPGRHP
jgi:hypothetical protein